MYQALYRKWRSRTFDQVVGQEHVTRTLKRQVETGRLSHAYLFTGTRGTGKTSCAKLLARAVNCEHPEGGNPCNACPSCLGIENGSILDVLELDAASNNRVDDIRAILDEAVYTPATVKKRVYIIDEVHMLSPQAFNALLQILEEPPAHLMFILATTEIHKVPATIKSRCQQFAFKRIRAEDIAAHLLRVARAEGFSLTEGGAALIARLSDGGMRDALSLLDQCQCDRGGAETVDEGRVYACLGLAGNVETARLLMDAAQGDAAAALERLDQLYANGKEMTALAGELSALVRDLLVRKTAPKAGAALMTGGFDGETLRRLSARFEAPRLVQMLTLLQKTAAELTRSANRRTDMELCLVTLCDPTLDGSPAGLSARIARLERGGAPVQASPPLREAPAPPEQRGREELPLPEEPPLPDEPPLPGELPMERDTAVPEEPPMERAAPLERPAAPVPEPEPGPRAERPAPAAEPVPANVPGWPGWAAFLEQLKGQVDIGDYSMISNPAMAQGRFDGSGLTVWTSIDVVKNVLASPKVAQPMARLCEKLTGAARQVEVKAGQAPPEEPPAGRGVPIPPAADALDAFLARGGDNIIVE